MAFVKVLVVIALCVVVVRGVPHPEVPQENDTSESDFMKGVIKCAFKTGTDDVATCATEKMVRSLNTLSAQKNLEIFPGVNLISDGNSEKFRSGKELNDNLENELTSNSMFDLITNATARLFSGRTLKIKLPDSETISRALQEGVMKNRRSKNSNKKGGNGMMMGVMGIGAALAALTPLFLGKLAIISVKALILGTLALVLSGVAFFQNFFSGNKSNQAGSGFLAPQTSYGVPSYGSTGQSAQFPYARSLNEDEAKSNQMAYSAYQ
ncbi:uncharacterized protein LOC132703691 isoform X2 [Cylas formicarius]|uniref:uncharacterized protein LOC132703691 isoform X2 n=1 Tax=Cylas formicarius TaxID=197179 RepID=UPI00295850B6|nr:uncharacterized protein LOC132703691 isoform X2 [Cylas formicarius]